MRSEKCKNKKFSRIAAVIISLILLLVISAVISEAVPSSTYQIRYSGNGASGKRYSQTFGRNQIVSLSAVRFSRTGYTFQGWSRSTTGAVEFNDKQKVCNVGVAGTAVDFFAVWKANTATVKFDANGGSGRMLTERLSFDKAKSIPSCGFTKSGYEFAGWTLKIVSEGLFGYSVDGTASGLVEFYAEGTQPAGWEKVLCRDCEMVRKINAKDGASVTFVANWKYIPLKYTISFNANGGTGTMSSITGIEGSTVSLIPNTITRSGYKFVGWSETANGTVEYADGEEITLNKNVTLYAVWVPNCFTVRFDANGGEGTMDDQTVTFGTPLNLSLNKFTREGYAFKGWYRYRSSDDKWFYTNGTSSAWYNAGEQPAGYELYVLEDGNQVAKTSTVDGDVCIFAAVWEKIPYTVVFDANGGTGTMNTQTITQADAILNSNEFSLSGYHFAGWSLTAGGAAAYSDGAAVNFTSDTTLYAVWEVNTFTVRFDANGGEGTMDDQTVTFGTPLDLSLNKFTREGYVFKGWYRYRSSDDKWFYTNGTSSAWYNAGEQPAGYELYVLGDGHQVSKTSTVDGDVCIFAAVWEKYIYTVVFDANGGTGTMNTQTITHADTILDSNEFSLSGYHFAGWSLTAGGAAVYSDGAAVSLTDDTTLYAVWKANTYTVRYDANGGEGTMSDTVVTYGVNTALTNNTFTYAGHHFAGWYRYRTSDNKWYYTNGTVSGWYEEGSQPAGYTLSILNDGKSVSKTSAVDGDICVLYAVWEVGTFTIHFDANGGKGTMADQTVTYGVSTPTTVNAFYRSGYVFAGWYAERGSTGYWAYKGTNGAATFYAKDQQPSGLELYVYSNGQKVSKTSSVDGDIVTFYAVWEKAPVVSLKGKKVLFIGNSMLFYGHCVNSGSQLSSDGGYFYQLCKERGETCTVIDCAYGSHSLDDYLGKCDNCSTPADHLASLDLGSFDYVFMCQVTEKTNLTTICKNLMKRFTNSKTQFIYMCPTYTYQQGYTSMKNQLPTLQNMGIKVVNFGQLCYEVWKGTKAVPGATLKYNKNTFIIDGNDSNHPNLLTGYIEAAMCYCAVTGQSAVGLPYAFATNTSINSAFDASAFITKNYTNGTTNFDKVFKSAADMKGLQQLIDTYNKKWGCGPVA